jgi:hypothetical protein
VHEHVGGLDVTVDDAVCVCGREHVEHLVGDREHVGRQEAASDAAEPRLERFAVEQLHDEKRRAVRRGVVVEDGDRAAVVDLVSRVAFAERKRSRTGCARRVERQQHLDATFLPFRCVAANTAAMPRCRAPYRGCHLPLSVAHRESA